MRHVLAFSAFLTFASAAGAFAQQTDGQPAAPGQMAAVTTPESSAPSDAAAELTPVQKTFAQCQACHTFEKGAKTLIGPNLHGVFGRRAASIEGYRYSVNMKQLGETGHVWSEDTLRPYLTNPRAIVPKTAMRFPGIPNEQVLNEFLPFLKEVTSAP
ncbi:cytochrome c family protein [Craurococcus roseus]|uniref:Cytochrome c family protein n=1 Tax=Craurococcus roseus TaxID=77585 RepID=A0ABP3RHM7_9PROT